LTGVPTSLEWLDEQTAGWQRGDLVILAARPSLGKTALAIQAALHAAETGRSVLFFSLEQSGAQIAERAISHLSGVSMQAVLQPKRIEEHEWPKITAASARIDALPLLIDESGALTVDAICARSRQADASKRLGLIVIDYLTQIMPPKANTTADAVQQITRQLKALAKALNVSIILLSQLNRDGDGKPALKHLRDSGAIEQDADVVIFLHRPDESRRDLIELSIAKHRNGACDSTFLAAHMERMRFVQTDDRPAAKPANVRGFGDYKRREPYAN
jgi:replicative DNA helicase